MNKNIPLGVDGVSTPDEDEYSLPLSAPPKIKTEDEEEKRRKKNPIFSSGSTNE